MMGLIWAILIGALAGALAKLIMPGKDPGGFWITSLLGIGGALVAKFAGQALGWYREGDGVGLVGSVVGAIVILAIYRMVKKPAK